METMKRAMFGVLVGAIAAVAACAPAPPAAPTVDVAAEEAAIRAVSARWLELEGARDAAGIAGLFTDDGRLVWTGQEPVVGPAAIQAFLTKEHQDNPHQKSSWTTGQVIVAAAGDLAVEYGNYSNTGMGADGAGSSRGSYVTVFQKVNGTWKVKADASASATPPAGGI